MRSICVVLHVLREHWLYVKFSKCDFWLQKVKFMVHVILAEEIAIHPTMIEPILDWHQPT